MIQLQSRVNPYIGDADYDTRSWQVCDEATIVTKDMRSYLRQSQPNHGGERTYRIVNTKKSPELAL